MAALKIHRDESPEGVTLRLEGTLDDHTVHEVHRTLDALGGRPVVLDFSHLREFRDTAVPELTRDLSARGVQVRGLADHHARVLRCFGVGLAGAPRPYYTPEELMAL
jgi:hypothetical protein